jgi:hypothetical protein
MNTWNECLGQGTIKIATTGDGPLRWLFCYGCIEMALTDPGWYGTGWGQQMQGRRSLLGGDMADREAISPVVIALE